MVVRHKKAFTLVELMMVLGIIGILLGIITTTAAGAIKTAREHKATACCKIVQQGIATYYAQKGKWPGSIGSAIANGTLGTSADDEDSKDVTKFQDTDVYNLNAQQIDSMIRDLIEETRKQNPMLDISGLFVSRGTGENGVKSFGLDFMQAIRGTKKSPKKMKVSEMHFGYPGKDGYFKRFKVKYYITSDEMKVSKQEADK